MAADHDSHDERLRLVVGGEFHSLDITRTGGHLQKGPWRFDHHGFGLHGFTNDAGDFIPVTAVARAYRNDPKEN